MEARAAPPWEDVAQAFLCLDIQTGKLRVSLWLSCQISSSKKKQWLTRKTCALDMWGPCPLATLSSAICQSHWTLVSGTAFRDCLKGLQQWPWCSAPRKLASGQDSSLSTWLSSATAIFHGKTCPAKETGWDVLPNSTSKLLCFGNCPLSLWPGWVPHWLSEAALLDTHPGSTIPCGLALSPISQGHLFGPYSLPVFSGAVQHCQRGPESFGSALRPRCISGFTGKTAGLATLLLTTPTSCALRVFTWITGTARVPCGGGWGLPSHGRSPGWTVSPQPPLPGPCAPPLPSL